MSDQKSLLETIVERTPTQVDDAALQAITDMWQKYPFLKDFLFDMLIKMIMKKGN